MTDGLSPDARERIAAGVAHRTRGRSLTASERALVRAGFVPASLCAEVTGE